MKKYSLFLSLLGLFLITSCKNTAPIHEKTTTASQDNTAITKESSLEENITFIQKKYELIKQMEDYESVLVEAQCDDNSSNKLERRYNSKGALSYLKYRSCGAHACSTKHHYYWDGQLIFIFHKNDYAPGNSHIIEEHRTYFKNGKMIRCLEKKAHQHPGQAPIEELLEKAENKEVECSPEKLTINLAELEALSSGEAQKYFCSTTTEMLGTFYSTDCSEHLEMESFSCECDFSLDGNSKTPALFVSNMDKKACIKVKGQLNALYPDWEERNYKQELKELSERKEWISFEGENLSYFGKPLSFYKYESEVEFLTDVILASGKNMDEIPVQKSNKTEAFGKIETKIHEAIAKAKAYKTKGGNDPLTIVKMDNRSYDVFMRYRQITQYEGEANHYEGTLTLLKNRGTEILETKPLKGTCGC